MYRRLVSVSVSLEVRESSRGRMKSAELGTTENLMTNFARIAPRTTKKLLWSKGTSNVLWNPVRGGVEALSPDGRGSSALPDGHEGWRYVVLERVISRLRCDATWVDDRQEADQPWRSGREDGGEEMRPVGEGVVGDGPLPHTFNSKALHDWSTRGCSLLTGACCSVESTAVPPAPPSRSWMGFIGLIDALQICPSIPSTGMRARITVLCSDGAAASTVMPTASLRSMLPYMHSTPQAVSAYPGGASPIFFQAQVRG